MMKLNILIIAFFGIIALTSSVSIPAIQQYRGNVDVLVIENIEDYKRANPNVQVIPLNKEVQELKARAFGQRAPIRYSMGVRYPTDRLLTSGQNSLRYPTLQDVTIQLTYPQSGTGGIVRFVEIMVEQSSQIGQAYIVGGGLNTRNIRVAVEAKQTTFFNYSAVFYGYY